MEVKPFGKKSSYQLQSDLVKLGKEMKIMLDHLIDYGIKNARVCGVLIESYECWTYMMDLEYDSIYRMVELSNCKLINDPYAVMLITRLVEAFLQVKYIITNTAIAIENKLDADHENNENSFASSSIPFERSSCGFLKKLQKD